MANELIRNRLQKAIYVVINPLVKWLIKLGFTPNVVTITGLIVNIGVAIFLLWAPKKATGATFRM